MAITGGTFYDPSAGVADPFPASYAGDYFFADYGIGFVKALQLNQGSAATGYPVISFATGLNHPTDLKVGPDGALYALEHGSTDNDGAVVRFIPAATNTPPNLVGTVQSVPGSAVECDKGRVIIRIADAGSSVASGRIGLTLLLLSDQTADPSDVPLASVRTTLRVVPGKSTAVPIRFHFPSLSPSGAGVPAGVYYLIAQINPLSGSALGSPANVAVSMTPVTVVSSPIDLSGSFVTIPTVVLAGHKATAILEIDNTGTGTAAGLLSIGLDAEMQSMEAAYEATFSTVRRQIHLRGGTSVRIKVNFVVSKKVPVGTYTLNAQIDSDNRFAESNEFDNDVTSTGTFTVE